MQISSVNQNNELLNPTGISQKENVSIWNNNIQNTSGNNSVDEVYISEFDKRIEDLAKKLAEKFENFTKEDLLNFFKNCGINIDNIASNPQADMDRFFRFWEKRISECQSLEELNQLAENHKIAKDMGLAGLLKNYLPNGVKSLDEVSDSDLKNAVEVFITEQMDKPHEEVDINRKMKFFMKLLDGTSDKDKIRLYNAFKEVAAKNGQVSEMFDMMILSIAKSEDVQNFINQIPIETFEILGLSKEEVLKAIKILVENGDIDYVEKVKQELEAKLEKFFNENQETINSIKQKITNKKEELGRELSDEEILDLLKNSPEELKLYQAKMTLKSMSGGFELGSASNKIITKEQKTDIIKKFDKKLEEYGFSEEVIEEVKKYIQEHREEFTDNLENLTEILNSATEGKFGEIVLDVDGTEDYDDTSGTDFAGIGFYQSRTSEEYLSSKENLSEMTNAIPNDENRKIIVEKNESNLTGGCLTSSIDFQNAVRKGTLTLFGAVNEAVSNYSSLMESGKQWCLEKLSNMSGTVVNFVLSSGASGSTLVALAEKGINIDTKIISTNYDTKKRLEEV